MPQLSFEMIQTALPDAFTIAILAAIESLLSLSLIHISEPTRP